MAHETKPSSSPQKPSLLENLLGTLVVVSFFVVSLFSRSSTPPQPVQDSKDSDSRDKPSEDQTTRSENIPAATRGIPISTVEPTDRPPSQSPTDSQNQHPTKRPSQRVQWWIFAITTVYAGITALLWSNASEQLEIEQRSWVVFDYNYSDKFELRPEKSYVSVPFRLVNIGKTPAIKAEGFVIVEELKRGEHPAFVYRTDHAKTMRASILYQGSDWGEDIPVPELDGGKPVPVTEPKRRDYQSGNIFFIVWGQLEYFDVFHEQHWVHFCHAITNNPLEKTTECNEYNTVDTHPHFGWNSVKRTAARIVRTYD